MDVRLHLPHKISNQKIAITGSKSETNRLLLLQALYPLISILNVSESDDSVVMKKALSSAERIIDVHHAGTAMRFLTAYFAMQQGREVVLTGSHRMKERPVKILVDALRELGADIEYLEKEGFPPLKIVGKNLMGGKLEMKASTSSQYITALLLIAPKMKDGLQLTLEGEITSRPYIDMTLTLLNELGIDFEFQGNIISIKPGIKAGNPITVAVESDWSSASYFYSIIALAEEGSSITLTTFKKDSRQGDSKLVDIYRQFGVATTFSGDGITLVKIAARYSDVHIDLKDTPDIAQTIAVTCLGLGIDCCLTGLHTLRIKETDRLDALKHEMEKLGAKVQITDDTFILQCAGPIVPDVKIETYNDHRMAMAFSPLAVRIPIIIKDRDVVSKSYPQFWNDLSDIGMIVEPINGKQ